MLVEIDGQWFNPELVAHVRPVTNRKGDDTGQTVIFMQGCSPVDGGILLDIPVEDVISTLQRSAYLALVESLEGKMTDSNSIGTRDDNDSDSDSNSHSDQSSPLVADRNRG